MKEGNRSVPQGCVILCLTFRKKGDAEIFRRTNSSDKMILPSCVRLLRKGVKEKLMIIIDLQFSTELKPHDNSLEW